MSQQSRQKRTRKRKSRGARPRWTQQRSEHFRALWTAAAMESEDCTAHCSVCYPYRLHGRVIAPRDAFDVVLTGCCIMKAQDVIVLCHFLNLVRTEDPLYYAFLKKRFLTAIDEVVKEYELSVLLYKEFPWLHELAPHIEWHEWVYGRKTCP